MEIRAGNVLQMLAPMVFDETGLIRAIVVSVSLDAPRYLSRHMAAASLGRLFLNLPRVLLRYQQIKVKYNPLDSRYSCLFSSCSNKSADHDAHANTFYGTRTNE